MAAKSPIVEAVGNVRTGQVAAFGGKLFATAVNPPSSTMFHLDWITGSQQTMASLGATGAFVDKGYAKSHQHLAKKLGMDSPGIVEGKCAQHKPHRLRRNQSVANSRPIR